MSRLVLVAGGTVFLALACLATEPEVHPQWGFDRRVEGARDTVDASETIESTCSRSITRSIAGLELEVKFPEACNAIARETAETVGTSLDALVRMRAALRVSPPHAQVVIVPEERLPSSFTYVYRSATPTVGTLAVVSSCMPDRTSSESRSAIVASALLHELVHGSRIVDSYDERKSDWAREGAAEYLAIAALRSSAPGFVASQMRERRPLELLASLPERKRQSIIEGKHRGGKDEVGLSEVDRYTLYLAVFLEAERQGLVPLTPNSDPSGRRPPILGAPLKVVLAGMHRSEAAR